MSQYARVAHRINDAEWGEATAADGSTYPYHVVTSDTRGRVAVPGGYQDVVEGDILVPTAAGDSYIVYGPGQNPDIPSSDNGTDEQKDNNASTAPSTVDTANAADFDPTDNSAVRVRRTVSALVDEGNYDEASRIVNDERGDKNRKTAIPQNYADWEASQSDGGES